MGPGKSSLAGMKKLKESASHHLKETYSVNCIFCDFEVISRFVFDFKIAGDKTEKYRFF